MSKLRTVPLVISALVIGAFVGGFAMSRSIPENEAVTNTQSQIKQDKQIDVGDGLGMTPTEMLEELQEMESGDDFDHRYLNYITVMRNNEIGMARIASRKTERQELKDVAQNQIEQGTTLVNEMYTLTKLWGFTHH